MFIAYFIYLSEGIREDQLFILLTVLPSKNKAITYLLTYLYTKNIRNNVVFSYKTSNIETDVKTSIFTRCDILVRHSQTQTVLSIFVAGSSMYNQNNP